MAFTAPGVSMSVAGGGGSGSGTAYGKVPDPIAMPLSTYQQATQAMPGLPGLTQQTGNVIGSQLSGNVSPGTADYLQQLSAQWGVGAGMPGMGAGSMGASNLVRSLGLTSEQLSQQGVQNFNNTLGTLASTQLSPETQVGVNTYNTQLAAAPDPQLAAQQQIANMENLYSWEQEQQRGTTGDLYSLQSQAGQNPAQPGAKPGSMTPPNVFNSNDMPFSSTNMGGY